MARKTKAERRRELLTAARDVFVDRGFAASTIDDIVERAGVARGTFYLYFADKRAIFEALVDDFLSRISVAVRSIVLAPDAPSPVEQLRANVQRVVALAISEPAIVKLALHDATGVDPELDLKLDRYYEGLRALIEESLETGQELGIVRSGERRLMLAIGLGGFKEVLVDAVSGQIDTSPEEIADEIMHFLVGGLLVRA
ncbi:MAG: TetR/AcrR family transcriptional regulator [Sandaracinaceae bacterium]